MSIARQGDRWLVIARVRVNGKIIQRRETIDGTREQAKKRFEQLKHSARESAKGSLTTCVDFKHILQVYEEKRGPFSYSHQSVVKMLAAELGDVPPDRFVDRFENYLRGLRSTRTMRGTLPSGCLLNRRIEVVRAAFNVAVGVGLVERNPITRQRFPEKREIPRDVDVTEDDRARLIETARQNRRTVHIAEALNFALQVPVRRSEIVGMRVQDVDLFSKCVRVRNGTTKNDQGTYKPIPPDMLEYFTRRVREGRPEEPVFFRLVKGSRAERGGETARVVPLGDFKNAWDTIRTAAKLPHLRIHDTRHVSATAMVDAGTPEQVVMVVANWKTNMLRTYYHRDPKKALSLVQFAPTVKRECEAVAAVMGQKG